jgi:hypothetical protein
MAQTNSLGSRGSYTTCNLITTSLYLSPFYDSLALVPRVWDRMVWVEGYLEMDKHTFVTNATNCAMVFPVLCEQTK